MKEADLVELARLVKKERTVILGPASIVCLEGFYQALEQGEIHDGEMLLMNTGEGAARAKEFANSL